MLDILHKLARKTNESHGCFLCVRMVSGGLICNSLHTMINAQDLTFEGG